jgi:hypothetical protein
MERIDFGFFIIEFGYLIPLHPPIEKGELRFPPFIEGRKGGIIQRRF